MILMVILGDIGVVVVYVFYNKLNIDVVILYLKGKILLV